MSRLTSTLLFALLALRATAQTQPPSGCDPTWGNTTCLDNPALGTTLDYSFNNTLSEMDPQYFNVTAGASLISFGNDGAEMSILKAGDSVTVSTQFYILEGRAEIVMQAAKGVGIISTIILLSDTLDEIDWEILGGNETHVSNNWYGLGNTSQHNGEYPLLAGAMDTFHNYTIDWNQDRLQWIADGQMVRELKGAGKGLYPQTPSVIRFGIWAAGDPSLPQGTRDWAGGDTDYSKGPFTMKVKSVKITDAATNVTSYTYEDTSGEYKSVKANPGDSKAFLAIHKLTSAQKAAASWSHLSKTAKIAIASSVLGVLLVIIIVYTYVCITQRKKGRAEKAIADREWERHESELMEYKRQMQKGGFAVSHLGSGEVRY
ncbi:hypothetical protein LTR95_000727 [Oleoguttula sp. CCFEE 5521]